jgi:hypothetical protein
LTAAFGLRAAPAPEPFMVGAGLTSLLSDVANEGPLPCVIDDAQWLNQASARALAFAVRRIDSSSGSPWGLAALATVAADRTRWPPKARWPAGTSSRSWSRPASSPSRSPSWHYRDDNSAAG